MCSTEKKKKNIDMKEGARATVRKGVGIDAADFDSRSDGCNLAARRSSFMCDAGFAEEADKMEDSLLLFYLSLSTVLPFSASLCSRPDLSIRVRCRLTNRGHECVSPLPFPSQKCGVRVVFATLLCVSHC